MPKKKNPKSGPIRVDDLTQPPKTQTARSRPASGHSAYRFIEEASPAAPLPVLRRLAYELVAGLQTRVLEWIGPVDADGSVQTYARLRTEWLGKRLKRIGKR